METVTLPRLDPSAPRKFAGSWTMQRSPFDEMQIPHERLAVYRATLQDSITELIGARDLVVIDRRATKIEREGVYLVEIDGAIRLRSCSRDIETGAAIVSAPGLPAQTIPAPQLAARVRVFGRAVYRMSELP